MINKSHIPIGHIAIVAFIIIAIFALTFTSLYVQSHPTVTPKTEVMTTDYIGKVIQVNYYTSPSSLLFSGYTQTYVSFDNNQTYMQQGYNVFIIGNLYHVHSVTTISYGANTQGNGTLTTTVNTFNPEGAQP